MIASTYNIYLHVFVLVYYIRYLSRDVIYSVLKGSGFAEPFNKTTAL